MSDQATVAPPASPLPPLPTQECPFCGNITPVGNFCGVCGTHLTHDDPAHPLAARRPHAFSANPEEHVYRLSVISTLFPHLSHRSSTPFRVGFGLLVVFLIAFSASGLEAPVIALSAIGVPLLFQLYIWDVDVYEDDHVLLAAETLLIGAALGVAWALLGGHIVSQALAPVLDKSLGGWDVVKAAVFVPIVGQALMLVPLLLVLALVPGFGSRRESLDGFTLGAASALGFSFAAVITDMASQLSQGLVTHEPFTNTLTEALIRGVASPVLVAAATGLIGASIWVRRAERVPSRAAVLTNPLLILAVVLAIQVGTGFADQAHLSDIPLLVEHLVATAIVLLALRVGLHHILLNEQHDVAIGPAMTCAHCNHIIPRMPFCPSCGVAQVATTKRHRRPGLATLSTGAEPPDDVPFDAEESGRPVIGWPTLPEGAASASWHGYASAPAPVTGSGRAHHTWLVTMFSVGAGALVVALLLTALVKEPDTTPAHPCVDNICSRPPVNPPGTHPSGAFNTGAFTTGAFTSASLQTADTPDGPPVTPYKSPDGNFSVDLLLSWPGQGTVSVGARTSSLISFDFKSTSLGNTQLGGGLIEVADFTGVGGATAQQVVQAVINKNASSASMAYPMPDPLVGEVPGYGAVYNDNVNSSAGQQVTFRLMVMAAVKNGVAIVVWAEGPDDASFPSLPLLDHPSFVDMDVAALGLDPTINSIQWTKSSTLGASAG